MAMLLMTIVGGCYFNVGTACHNVFAEKQVERRSQGDQIGRIFACREDVYFGLEVGRALFLQVRDGLRLNTSVSGFFGHEKFTK
jgi:hypothetical protein